MKSYRQNGVGPIDESMPDFLELSGALPYEPTIDWHDPPPESELPRLADPYEAGDRVQWVSRAHAIETKPLAIDGTWRAWEIARFQVSSRRVGVVEQIGVSIDDVWAWDDPGTGQLQKIFSYGPQNGSRPTKSFLAHPNPLIGSLEWRFSVQGQNLGSNNPNPAIIVGSNAQQGSYQDEPWADLWSGSDLEWGQNHQRVMPSSSVLLLICWLRGPEGYFTARVGGRLAGYTQGAGHSQAALNSAINRH